jgi:hypothetical protein
MIRCRIHVPPIRSSGPRNHTHATIRKNLDSPRHRIHVPSIPSPWTRVPGFPSTPGLPTHHFGPLPKTSAAPSE